MEWDLKLPHWDFSELEDSVVASNGSLDHHLRGHDCSVDLKLGGLGDFGSSEKRKEQPIVSMASMPASSLSSSASKRARALRNGGYVVSCLVDGCVSDLSKCREYHRRHKVCELHSKTPVVTVGGREQRFCQQCSRFHLLVEFDEVKRSCRKRLDGHNRRRRKPQPDFINTRSLIANHPGARFSVYPQIFPTAAPEPNWTRIIKSEEDVLYTNSLPLHLIDSHQQFSNYKEGKQFPFLQDGYALIRSRESRTIASSQSNECKIYPDGVAPVLTSDCALSLLSSSSQTSGIDLSQVVPGSRIPMGQPLVSGLQYNGSGRYSCPQASSTVLPAAVFTCSGMKAYGPDICDTDLHCGCLFHLGGEGSSDGTSQALPFSWQQ